MNNTTKKIGLIGWPITHSISPTMHNAAFAAMGLDYYYTLLPTKPGELATIIKNFKANGFVGGNVTMPYKQEVMEYLDEISNDARIIGAVNTINVENDKLVGYNVDSIGFINALQHAGHNPIGMHVVVLGAGGAARSAVFALANAGVTQITVINRTISKGEKLTEEMVSAFPLCKIDFQPLMPETLQAIPMDIDLIVNATSIGMEPNSGLSIWPDNVPLPTKAVYYDVIYKPIQTYFLQRAIAAGRPTLNGVGMVVLQGVIGFKIWTGKEAPVDIMWQSVQRGLGYAGNRAE